MALQRIASCPPRKTQADCHDNPRGDLDNLEDGLALNVPLAELAKTKEKVRSALNRATGCNAPQSFP
jgi:hypothetical protein